MHIACQGQVWAQKILDEQGFDDSDYDEESIRLLVQFAISTGSKWAQKALYNFSENSDKIPVDMVTELYLIAAKGHEWAQSVIDNLSYDEKQIQSTVVLPLVENALKGDTWQKTTIEYIIGQQYPITDDAISIMIDAAEKKDDWAYRCLQDIAEFCNLSTTNYEKLFRQKSYGNAFALEIMESNVSNGNKLGDKTIVELIKNSRHNKNWCYELLKSYIENENVFSEQAETALLDSGSDDLIKLYIGIFYPEIEI